MTENNAAQPGQDPLFEAIDILTVAADELRHSHALGNSFDDWTGEPEAKAEYDRTLRVVAALSKLRAEGVQAGDERCKRCGGPGWHTSHTTGYPESIPCSACDPQGVSVEKLENDPFLAAQLWRKPVADGTALASAPVAEPETMEEIHRRERERAPWVLPKDPTLPDSAPVAGEAVAVLRREIGESSWFDHRPVRPGSEEHAAIQKSAEWDYCPVYAAPQASEAAPFSPDWANYRQRLEDGKAEASEAVRDAALEEAAVIAENSYADAHIRIRALKTQADKDGAAVDLSAISDIALEVETRKRGVLPKVLGQCAYELGYFNPSLPRPAVTFAHALDAVAYRCGQADAQNNAPLNRDFRVDQYDEGFERKDGGDCAKGAGAVAMRDAAFEAVRKRLCAIPRYSFYLDDDGVVRRVEGRSGNWIEFDAAHELFDPVAVDAALSPTPSAVKQSLTATQTGEKGEKDE